MISSARTSAKRSRILATSKAPDACPSLEAGAFLEWSSAGADCDTLLPMMPRLTRPHRTLQAPRYFKSGPTGIYQFKITLLGIEPPIWRRIQVPDGTVDKLNEHIQTAMGWTNSHLHEFTINGRRYGDPALLGDGGSERDFVDSTEIRLSQFLGSELQGFCFVYLYDFGDNWRHEIVYEGPSSADSGERYPRCVEGAGGCPPDDCGRPEKFSPATATKAMIRGLPNWRDLR